MAKNKEEKKKFSKKQEGERKEAWMRIIVGIVSGFMLEVWGFFIFCFAIVQFILVLIEGKKNKELLRMSEVYLVQIYTFVRYITFISNERPFPFADLKKEINKE